MEVELHTFMTTVLGGCGQCHTSTAFYSRKDLVLNWTRGWVDPGAVLEVVVSRKIPPLSGIEPGTFQSVASCSTNQTTQLPAKMSFACDELQYELLFS